MPSKPKIPKGGPRPRAAVLNMAPYSPPTGNRAGNLRLDFNENTIGSSPRIVEYLKQQLTPERLSIYPGRVPHAGQQRVDVGVIVVRSDGDARRAVEIEAVHQRSKEGQN